MRTPTQSQQAGFSLVEVMIGMVMGLVVMLVIYQVYTTFEGQKRTSTYSAEAQENGLFAVTTMERDLRAAGWGIANKALLNCTEMFTYYKPDDGKGNSGKGGLISEFSMMPVKIVDGGTGPDKITILSGSNVTAGAENKVIKTIGNGTQIEFVPSSTVGYNIGDMVWMVQGNQCTLSEITNVQNSDHLQREGGNNSKFNPPSNSIKKGLNWPDEDGWDLHNMGSMIWRTYSVEPTTKTLQFSELTAGTMDLVSNIVSIKAYYGISNTPADQTVTSWVAAAKNTIWETPAPSDAMRIKAVRLAVIARSPLLEKPDATTGACTTTTTAPVTWEGGPTIDLSSDTQWQCYRYKSFQTIIPLRNVLWADLS